MNNLRIGLMSAALVAGLATASAQQCCKIGRAHV